jgi:hypothetical protein
MSVPVLTAVIIASIAVPLVGLVLFLRNIKRRTESAATEVGEAVGTVSRFAKNANFFGLQSLGMGQVRGNGCLALGANKLAFVMWLPRRLVEIERSSIKSVSTSKTHLGRTRGVPLLVIDFVSADGNDDKAAWLVGDLQGWLEKLAPAGEDGNDSRSGPLNSVERRSAGGLSPQLTR